MGIFKLKIRVSAPKEAIKRRTTKVGVLCCLVAIASPLIAQSGRVRTDDPTGPETRSAQELFDEANSYIDKRFTELNQQQVAYDPNLDATLRQEQRDLAERNAAVLKAREPLNGNDVYYLGMLKHLSKNAGGALEAMRRFLANSPEGEMAQNARAVVILYAVKNDLIPEAEAAAAAYSENQPREIKELFGIETLLAEVAAKAKDYERMARHARAMFTVARSTVPNRKFETFKRDEMLLRAATLLSEAFIGLNQKERVPGVFKELRRIAISLPSGYLYKLATIRLIAIDAKAAGDEIFEDSTSIDSKPPPEIVGAEWIDEQPTTLEELRGRVVLLDFWAPWCGPCRVTFPKLQKWHETYKNKGLVVLGLTTFYGNAEGKKLNPTEELAYLRDFKKKNRLPYGFVVANSAANGINYGVFSIPMSFLIDRAGNLRFIAAGASDLETTALGKMIQKLVDEPAPPATAASGNAAKR